MTIAVPELQFIAKETNCEVDAPAKMPPLLGLHDELLPAVVHCHVQPGAALEIVAVQVMGANPVQLKPDIDGGEAGETVRGNDWLAQGTPLLQAVSVMT